MMPCPPRIIGRLASLISCDGALVRFAVGRVGRGGSRAAAPEFRPLPVGLPLLCILGDVHQHRAGPPDTGDVERLADRRADVLGPVTR